MKESLAKKVLYRILILGLAVSPFLFWPYASVPFEIPKVWIINRWIELLGIMTVVLFPAIYKKNNGDRKLTFIILGFLTVAIIASFFGENINKSFWGNYYRADGIYTLIHLIIFYFFVALTVEQKSVGSILKTISYSSIVLSGVTIILTVAYYLFNFNLKFFPPWEGAFAGVFGNPNFLAGYLLVTLPFIFASFKTKKLILFASITITAILLTKAWAGVLGIFIFFIIYHLVKNRKNIFVPVFYLLILITLVFVYYKNNPAFSYQKAYSAESRERIIVKGLLAVKERPILGWGWANFDYAFEKKDWPVKFYNDVYVDKAHSHFLEILVTTGIAGFLIYLLLITKIFYNLVKINTPYKIYLLLSLILFVLHSQTNVVSVSEELIFWLLAGLSTIKG